MAGASHKPPVIVTGSSGMLGSVLMPILAADYSVVGTSRDPKKGVVCDLSEERQTARLIKDHKPALLIHAAAFSDVDGCERDPGEAYKANALSSKWLSKYCSASGVPWIYVSTDYVFDGRKDRFYRESDPTGPVNIYGVTKLLGEFYAHASTAPSVIVRTSWLFGSANPNNFVNAILKKCQQEESVSVLDDQTDCPTSVKDLSVALKFIGEYLIRKKNEGTKNAAEIFHVCNAGATTRLEMTREIKKILLLPVKVQKTDRSRIPSRLAIRPVYAAMGTEKFEKFSGTRLRPWQEALQEFLVDTVTQ